MADRLLRTLTFPNLGTYQIQDYNILPRKSLPSAPIHSFSDGADNIPIKAMEVSVRAVQDLHGQSAPYPAGGGKNKLPLADVAQTSSNGITYSVKNGLLALSGNATAAVTITIPTLSSFSLVGALQNIAFNNSFVNNNVTVVFGSQSWAVREANRVITDASDVTINSVAIGIANGAYVNGTIGLVVLDKSIADTTFAPYSNIAPISGWTQAQIVGSGKNLTDWKVNITASALHMFLPSGQYTISGASTLSDGNWYLRFTVGGAYVDDASNVGLNGWSLASSGWFYGNPASQSTTFTVPSGCSLVEIGKMGANGTIPAMLNLGGTAQTYVPYNGHLTTINFGGTVYGGLLEYVGGLEWEFTPTDEILDLGTQTWTTLGSGRHSCGLPANIKVVQNTQKMNGICSQYAVVRGQDIATTDMSIGMLNENTITVNDSVHNGESAADFKAAMSGVMLKYELAQALDPVTVYADAEVVTEYGDNTLYADCGDSSLTYRQDIGIILGE